jgi:hypothetical protein
VVFAEHSEHGYLAAPIAKHIMETYFAQQDGVALPVLKVPAPPGAPARPPAPPRPTAATTVAFNR